MEFDYNIFTFKAEIEDENLIKISSIDKQKIKAVKLFGTYLRFEYSIDLKAKMKHIDNNYTRWFKDKFVYSFDLLDISEFKINKTKQKDEFNEQLYELTFVCKDGLNNIKVSLLYELFRNSVDEKENEWDILEDEGDVEDYYTNKFSIDCTNKEFLHSFVGRLNELKEITLKMK